MATDKNNSQRRAGGGRKARMRGGGMQPRPHGRGASATHPARAGEGWVYGLHAALATLANEAREIERILVFEGAAAQVADVLRRRQAPAPQPEPADRAAIGRLLPEGAVHQGLAVLARPLPETTLDGLLRATTPPADAGSGQPTLLVVLDQVTDPHNVGAILRSAAAFGAAGLVVTERHAPAATGTLAKAASGGLEAVPMVSVVNLVRALDEIKEAGFWCVGLDHTADSEIAAVAAGPRVALVLGAEGSGLRRLTREHCDLLARLPTRPPIESLNVSNAAAIALYALTVQQAR